MERLLISNSKESTACCDDNCCTTVAPAKDLKKAIKEKYTDIAEGREISCCEGTCCVGPEDVSMADSYTNIAGYEKDADLNLGCGLPTQFALIEKGDVVVDLGSGAGNDCFVARHETGETGKVIGVDITEAMIQKARRNVFKLGYNNVEFVHGDIENIPLPENVAEVVVSNCVFNLVPDKAKAFKETFRILKPGGHFSISDVVTIGELPEKLQGDVELYVGCVAGAVQKVNYLQTIQEAGFKNLKLQKEKRIEIPLELVRQFCSEEEMNQYLRGEIGIYSVTVYAEKPE